MTHSTGDWRPYLRLAHRLADAAGPIIRGHFRETLHVDDKEGMSDFDPVTAADQEAEAAMRALIREAYPHHAIIGEESAAEAGGPETWVLDPIDGTRAFITGFPTWGTLIAFNDGTRPVVGIMDQPITGERFVGTPSGATLGDRPLRTRDCASLSDAVLYATTPDMFTDSEEKTAFARVEGGVKLRRFGGDCYAYCMLALGCVDLVIEATLKPYDIQALIPVIEGAGGVVTGWDGGDAQNGGRVIAAGSKAVHAAALKLLRGE